MNTYACRFDSVLFCRLSLIITLIFMFPSIISRSHVLLLYRMDNGQHHKTDDNSRIFCLYNCFIVMFFSISLLLFSGLDKNDMNINRQAYDQMSDSIHQTRSNDSIYMLMWITTMAHACGQEMIDVIFRK